MNKDDTLQAIVDHYEIAHYLFKEALSDAFDKGVGMYRTGATEKIKPQSWYKRSPFTTDNHE